MYKSTIEADTEKNTYYRRVEYTTPQMQLVLMSIPRGIEIGSEIHPKTTQFIRVEKGTGVATVGTRRVLLKAGDALMIPPNTRHNVKSTSQALKLYTLYSPPEHPPTGIERSKIKSGSI